MVLLHSILTWGAIFVRFAYAQYQSNLVLEDYKGQQTTSKAPSFIFTNFSTTSVPVTTAGSPQISSTTNAPVPQQRPTTSTSSAPFTFSPPTLRPVPPQPVTFATQQPRPRPTCLLRTCEQTITGRFLSYERALQIVQSEEYLDAADIDVIRRNQYYAPAWTAHDHRSKRQTSLSCPPGTTPVFDTFASTQTCEPISTSSSNSSSAPSESTNPDSVIAQGVAITLGIAAVGIAGVGTGVIGGVSAPAVNPGQAPPNAPQPGQLGGGAPPTGASPTVLTALSLVPLGLVPVAVFPPYATPRTVPAISVIFSEAPVAPASRKDYRNNKKVKPNLYRETKKKVNSFVRNLVCFKDRFLRKYNPDCMPRMPLYGFRTLVTLVDQEPCIKDVTCNIFGDKLTHRQAGEEFSSDAPPDCRAIQSNDANVCLK